MPTFAQFRQRMLELEPSLGRVETVTALTGSSVRVAALATGTILAGKFKNAWLLRPEAADPADRVRLVSGFESDSGTLTHGGANYVDTIASAETVELQEYEPYLLDQAIQESLRTTKRLVRVELPARQDGVYALAPFDWIQRPSEVVRTGERSLRVLSPSRHFERWSQYGADGMLRPDLWALAGSGATFSRATSARRGPYALGVQRQGADATVAFTVGLLETGVAGDSLRGEMVTAVLVGQSAQAGSLTVRVEDGLTSSVSAAHSGGGAWEELTAQHAVAAAATTLTLTARVAVDETAILDELYLVLGQLDDAHRRDADPLRWLPAPRFTQEPLAWLGPRGRGEQLVLEGMRAYPAFQASRVRAGTADGDPSDAPLDLVAHRALAIFFENRAASPDGTPLDGQKAAVHRKRADRLGAAHLYEEDSGRGFALPVALPFGGRARGG